MAAKKFSGPWHIWVVGVVSFVWSAMGAGDLIMTQTRNAEYMANFGPEQLEFFYSFPIWLVVIWAIAVFGGVIGALLLLLRKTWAVHAFLASLVAMVLTSFHNYVLSNGLDVIGDPFSLTFTGVIFLVAVLLYVYSRAMKKRGVLA